MLCFSQDPSRCQRKAEIQLKYLVCLFFKYQLGLGITDGGPPRESCRKPRCFGEDTGKVEKYLLYQKRRKEGNTKYVGSMEKKEYACSLVLLSEVFKSDWFAPTRKATETNFTSISFSRQLQQKKTLSSTQNCTAPAMPILLFMRPHDHATYLSLKR